MDGRWGLEVDSNQPEACFCELLGWNTGNGLTEPASQGLLSCRRRRELLAHDSVLIDRSLEWNEVRAPLRRGGPEWDHWGQKQQDDNSEAGGPGLANSCACGRLEHRRYSQCFSHSVWTLRAPRV